MYQTVLTFSRKKRNKKNVCFVLFLLRRGDEFQKQRRSREQQQQERQTFFFFFGRQSGSWQGSRYYYYYYYCLIRVYFGFIQSGFVSNHFCSTLCSPAGKDAAAFPHTRDVMLSLSLSLRRWSRADPLKIISFLSGNSDCVCVVCVFI